jgi:hypothetical protein
MDSSEPTPTNEALASDWLHYQATKDDAAFDAVDAVIMLSLTDLERTWQIVLLLVAQASDDLLPAVGSGPLENLLHKFPAEAGARAAERARVDPRFKAALSRAWISRGGTPPAIREKLVLATDGRILILD